MIAAQQCNGSAKSRRFFKLIILQYTFSSVMHKKIVDPIPAELCEPTILWLALYIGVDDPSVKGLSSSRVVAEEDPLLCRRRRHCAQSSSVSKGSSKARFCRTCEHGIWKLSTPLCVLHLGEAVFVPSKRRTNLLLRSSSFFLLPRFRFRKKLDLLAHYRPKAVRRRDGNFGL